jgi:hypothetical protein
MHVSHDSVRRRVRLLGGAGEGGGAGAGAGKVGAGAVEGRAGGGAGTQMSEQLFPLHITYVPSNF